VISKKELCDKVFETLSWAGYIKPKWVPSENERPVAYVVILVMDPGNKWHPRDASLSAGNIILTAEENGIGSCILCKIDRQKLKEYLKIPDSIIIDSVIALGYKEEESVAEEFKGSIEYWRDEKELMHVPKRSLESIIHVDKF
jgi:nitroreductase